MTRENPTTYISKDENVVVVPQAMAPCEFAPEPEAEEDGCAAEEDPKANPDLDGGVVVHHIVVVAGKVHDRLHRLAKLHGGRTSRRGGCESDSDNTLDRRRQLEFGLGLGLELNSIRLDWRATRTGRACKEQEGSGDQKQKKEKRRARSTRSRSEQIKNQAQQEVKKVTSQKWLIQRRAIDRKENWMEKTKGRVVTKKAAQ